MVDEFLDFAARLRHLSGPEAQKRKELVIKVCGIEGVLGKDIGTLSKGYRQRVGLAQAIIHDPPILILDEPTAGLDPAGRDEILSLIKELHDKKGVTVILVSHSMEDVANYVDRIICVDKGRIKFDDTPREVFKHYKELEEMGLAAPQMTYMMRDLRAAGFHVETDCITVEEARNEILKCFGI
jgi:energy-coupling factor transport system ATP-binding protein